MNKKILSIIVPLHNEEQTIDAFHQAISAIFLKLPHITFEVICIDDGSKDTTLEKLIHLSKKDPRFRILELSRNFGKEAALTAGINEAIGDAVIPIDADLQDPPELILKMVDEWHKGAEVVLARRVDRSSDTFFKRKSSEMFYRAHNKLSSIHIPDNVGDFRLMDRCVVEALKQLPEQQRFMKGLFAWVGFKTVTLDYVRNPRVAGSSKFAGWKLWNFALEGITSFSTIPLKLWTYIGALGFLVTFIYALFIIARTVIFGIDLPGYASIFTAVLLVGSVQLIGIGVLGEYIGRVYMETKRRPLYLIRKYHGTKTTPSEKGSKTNDAAHTELFT